MRVFIVMEPFEYFYRNRVTRFLRNEIVSVFIVVESCEYFSQSNHVSIFRNRVM